MSCDKCKDLHDISDFDRLYTVQTCEGCGREIKQRNPGRHGIGIKIRKGDKVVLPPNSLTLSANPLKGSGQFSAHGISWFAEQVFGLEISRQESLDDFEGALLKLAESTESFFRDSDFLKDLDIDDPKNGEELNQRMLSRQRSVEWWAYSAGMFYTVAAQEVRSGNASRAAWAAATAERFRSLCVFKSYFEEAVFVGQSARRLVDLIRMWDSNRENSDESFWQIQLSENAYTISQLFSVPVTLIQEKAYVGGMGLDSKDARFLDFMFCGGNSNDAILLEIKAPTTKLLGSKYRSNVRA